MSSSVPMPGNHSKSFPSDPWLSDRRWREWLTKNWSLDLRSRQSWPSGRKWRADRKAKPRREWPGGKDGKRNMSFIRIIACPQVIGSHSPGTIPGRLYPHQGKGQIKEPIRDEYSPAETGWNFHNDYLIIHFSHRRREQAPETHFQRFSSAGFLCFENWRHLNEIRAGITEYIQNELCCL
jgi:hypothetical protein